MQSFVGDLLDLRQLKYGVFSLVNEPFDVMTVIRNICAIFAPQALAKNITLQAFVQGNLVEKSDDSLFCLNQSEPVVSMVMGDERRFKQVMINLVRNALKFTSRGLIEIKTDYMGPVDKTLSVSVRDTGAGIAEDDISLLFTRFGKL